jgi:hypothetical protein
MKRLMPNELTFVRLRVLVYLVKPSIVLNEDTLPDKLLTVAG